MLSHADGLDSFDWCHGNVAAALKVVGVNHMGPGSLDLFFCLVLLAFPKAAINETAHEDEDENDDHNENGDPVSA